MTLSCAACKSEIAPGRVFDGKAYCSCGAIMLLNPERHEPSIFSKGSLPLFLFTSLFVGILIHAINWDTYFFSIIPLKMKQLSGVANTSDLKKIAVICQARKKHTCQVEALEGAFARDKSEVEGLAQAGLVYTERKAYASAVRVLTTYYKSGGKNQEVRYPYARALGEIGRFNEAKKQYQYILQTNKKTPQYQVARSYVELLLKNNDYKTAKGVIEQYRKMDKNSSLFLEKELAQANKNLSLFYAKAKSL